MQTEELKLGRPGNEAIYLSVQLTKVGLAHIYPNYLTIITRKILKSNSKFLSINQVLWLGRPELEVTWESAASLPPAIIEEFEEGVQPQVVKRTDVQYGQQKCILSVTTTKPDDIALKKPRLERPVINKNTG